jgi:class 3 adenylate cyclase/tetratricopeptide (TPR) repeat protein
MRETTMFCHECSRRYEAGVKTCIVCGRPLRKVTGAFGGKPRPRPANRPERRQMTVLFCDIVGSTAISAGLDPEELLRILNLYQASCDEVIAQHRGYIASYMGDGVLAYFGYPHADENDAANAVRAGLALRDAIRELDVQADASLEVRIGVATGLVVVSDLVSRGEVREAGIVGDTPNLAARLQSVAPPGTVTIAESTWRLTRGLFNCRSLGTLALKGFANPVRALEVIEATGVGSRSRARIEEEATPFVGRQREAEMLIETWAEARAGRGQVVLVSGEAGIGKSRLLENLDLRLAGEPHLRMRWFCSPNHSDRPLRPLIEQMERAARFGHGDPAPVKLAKLKALLSQTGEPDEEAMTTLASLLSIPLSGPSALDAATPEKRKEVTFAALLARIARLSEAKPVLMIAEDLHWIDATSLELLDLLVRRAQDLRIMVVATFRPAFRARWTDLPGVTILEPGRLDDDSTREICSHIAGESLPPDVLRQIVARCDGIPLFAEELTKTVVEASAADQGLGATAAGRAAAIPLSLHDSLVARLDRLGPARQVANIGAAIGRSFQYDLLAAVAAKPAAELRPALRELTRSGLVKRRGMPPASTYVFKHVLIRDAAYESLLKSDRQKLHGLIASVLQTRFPDLPASAPELLAYHLSQGGAAAEAIPYWEQAGLNAASRAAHVEAVGHVRAALDLLRQLPDDDAKAGRELMLLVRLALSLSSSQGYVAQEVRDVLTEARAVCDRLGNVAVLYPVLRGICTFSIVSNDLAVAEEMAQRCLQISEQTGQPEHRIEADTPLAYVLVARGEYRQGQQHLERALRLYAENLGRGLVFPTEQDPKVACLSLLAFARQVQGDVAAGAAASREAVAFARSLKRPFDLAYALVWVSFYEAICGNFPQAKRFGAEAMELSEKHGFGLLLQAARLNHATAIGHLGEGERAIEALQTTLAEWRRIGARYTATAHIGHLALLQAASGRFEEALSTVDSAIAQAFAVGDLFYLSALHRIRADILGKLPGSSPELVAAELERAISVARTQGAATFEAAAAARLRHLPRRRLRVAAHAGAREA